MSASIDYDALATLALIEAYNILSDPARHLRHEAARTFDNRACSPYSPEAFSFDSKGAVEHATRHSYALEARAMRLLREAMIPDRSTTINALNDLLPHDMLMRRWARAIDILKERFNVDSGDANLYELARGDLGSNHLPTNHLVRHHRVAS